MNVFLYHICISIYSYIYRYVFRVHTDDGSVVVMFPARSRLGRCSNVDTFHASCFVFSVYIRDLFRVYIYIYTYI